MKGYLAARDAVADALTASEAIEFHPVTTSLLMSGARREESGRITRRRWKTFSII